MIPAVQHLNTRPTPTNPEPLEPVVTAFTAETITTRTHRWVIPVDGQQGVPLGAVEETVAVAATSARQAWGMAPDAPLPGDALTFTVEGPSIVIGFTVEERA